MILNNVKESIIKNLNFYKNFYQNKIINKIKKKFLKIGRSKGFISNPENLSDLTTKKHNFDQLLNSKNKIYFFIVVVLAIIISMIIFL